MNYASKITVKKVGETLDADLNLYCGRSATPSGMIDAQMGNEHACDKFCVKCEKHHTRNECIAANEMDILSSAKLIVRVNRIAQRLTEGKTVNLFCHCAPLPCHCDTIKHLAVQFAERAKNESLSRD